MRISVMKLISYYSREPFLKPKFVDLLDFFFTHFRERGIEFCNSEIKFTIIITRRGIYVGQDLFFL
jgi:hypothetical protein